MAETIIISEVDVNDDILTPNQAGALFGVSGWAMYKRVKKGISPGHYMGRRLYFLKSELVAGLRQISELSAK